MNYFQPFSQTPGPYPNYRNENYQQSSITYPNQTYLGGGYTSPLAYAVPPHQYMEPEPLPYERPQLFPAIPKQLPVLQKAKQDMKNLKEQRIIKAIERQTDILNEIIAKYGEAGDSKEALEKKIEELERQSIEIKFRRRQENMIKESVEKKINSLLNHGMSYNPFFPQPLPYLMFKLPKIKSNAEEEERMEQKRREVEEEELERRKKDERKRKKKKKTKLMKERESMMMDESTVLGPEGVGQEEQQLPQTEPSGYRANAAELNGMKSKKGRKGRRRGLPPIDVE